MRAYSAILFVALIAVMTGCVTTQQGSGDIDTGILGELTRIDQQYRATEVALTELDNIDRADLLIMLDKKRIAKEITTELKNRLRNVIVEGTKAALVNNISMSLGNQAINIKANFAVHTKLPNLIFKGKLDGVVAPGFEGNTLHFYPAFNGILLEDIDRNNIKLRLADFNNPKELMEKMKIKYSQQVAIRVGNAVLNNFLSNVNNQLFRKPISVPISISPIATTKFKNIIPATPGLAISGGEEDLVIAPVIKQAFFHINKERIAVMASMDILEPGRSGSKLFERSGPRNITQSVFDRTYQRLTTRTERMEKTSFYADGEKRSTGTHALISRNFIAKQLNKGFKEPEICLAYKTAESSERFSKKIKVGSAKLPDCKSLNGDCNTVYRECKSKITTCNGQCSSNYGSHKCSCADKSGLSRRKCELIERPACQLSEQGKRRACEDRETTCKTQANTKMLACAGKRTGCKIENESRRNKCDAKRRTLRTYGNLVEVATIKGKVSVHGTSAQACINSMEFSPNLSGITLDTNLIGLASVNVYADINSKGTGHLACHFSVSPNAHIDARLDQEVQIKTTITAKREGNTLKLKATATTPALTVIAKPSPLVGLFRDPKTAFNCSLVGSSVFSAAAADMTSLIDAPKITELLSGNINIKPKSFDLGFELKPIVVKLSKKPVTLKPVWKKRSIGYSL